jgi:hypothetical protein
MTDLMPLGENGKDLFKGNIHIPFGQRKED